MLILSMLTVIRFSASFVLRDARCLNYRARIRAGRLNRNRLTREANLAIPPARIRELVCKSVSARKMGEKKEFIITDATSNVR